MTLDPTRDELLAFLSAEFAEDDEFDREEAAYWFASDYHNGQLSNLYAALCASPYSPGHMSQGVKDSSPAGSIYDELVRQFYFGKV